MQTFNSFIIILLICILALGMSGEFDKIEEQINNIQPVINEQICEELLPYRFRGRQEFVCYKGDEIEYEPKEIVVIQQWKNR